MVKLAVRDVQYNLEISGQGERPLLLLHGFTGSSQNLSLIHISEPTRPY